MLLVAFAQAATTFGGSTFYAGDPHAHTGWSLDGGAADEGSVCFSSCGAWEDYFATARENGLDWVVNSDHVQGDPLPAATAEGFLESHLGALEADDPEGGFVTVPGAETWWTVNHHAVGHKTLMMFGDNATLADLTELDLQPTGSAAYDIADCEVIGDWMTTLTARFGDMLLIPHHPAATLPMATDWSCFHPEWEPAVEVYSGHGLSLVREPAYDPPIAGFDAEGSAEAALDPEGWGYHLGFMGGTDSHDTRPGSVCEQDGQHPDMADEGGLTLVVLPEGERFDRAQVRDAILARHTWATTGTQVPVLVHYSSSGMDTIGLGDDVSWPQRQHLTVTVELAPGDAEAVLDVQAVGDGAQWALTEVDAGTWSVEIPYDEAPAYVYAQVHLDGDAIYGQAGCADDGTDTTEYQWSSPSWITIVGSDIDEDGFTVEDGDCDDQDSSVSPGADERWYDGVDTDCGGDSDYDADGDGFDSSAWGGIDCDDGDPGRVWQCTQTFAGEVVRPPAADPVEKIPEEAGPGDTCGCHSSPLAFGVWCVSALFALRPRRRA